MAVHLRRFGICVSLERDLETQNRDRFREMNARDVSTFPILAALNLHPLHRRQGTVILRSEIEEALYDLKLETSPLPVYRLLNAYEVERILAESGISAELVRHRIS
jgi:L-alanine-DL-glutamate epimerase-like enolase superfamily enzyme